MYIYIYIYIVHLHILHEISKYIPRVTHAQEKYIRDLLLQMYITDVQFRFFNLDLSQSSPSQSLLV
jgi:hypothetical protein